MSRCLYFTEEELAERKKTPGMSGYPTPPKIARAHSPTAFQECPTCGSAMIQIDTPAGPMFYCPVCEPQ